ncbi:cytochrome P450 [Nocardia carnea]|uniref:cytochrome P450 n=1 Tax=Nocardia carnea TaxID=37328 RepID=UPI00245743BC|nr:cytochrome P450 [Nocardia carnea]
MSFDRVPAGAVVSGPAEADTEADPLPLYSERFAADPDPCYREARARFGALAPGLLAPDVPVTVVIGYDTALRILRNPEQFPADPRGWQRTAAAGCPMRPALEYRPDARRSAGGEHERYRRVYLDGLEQVDQHGVLAVVERIAVPLINAFCGRGAADLRTEYAAPLAFQVINHLLGIGGNAAEHAGRAVSAILAAREAAAIDAAREELAAVLLDVIRQKVVAPGMDMVSRLIAHPAELSEQELVSQIALTYEMGIEPLVSLILNALRSMLADEQLDGMLGGAVSTRDALDEVLFNDPPISHAGVVFPPRPQLVDDVWLWENRPVVVSLAGCNQDPAVRRRDPKTDTGVRGGNRSHLAWGLGDHACPASDIALLIATAAIDQLMDALPDMALTVPAEQLSWRADPFYRALTSLPVTFASAPPLPS